MVEIVEKFFTVRRFKATTITQCRSAACIYFIRFILKISSYIRIIESHSRQQKHYTFATLHSRVFNVANFFVFTLVFLQKKAEEVVADFDFLRKAQIRHLKNG